MGRLVRSSRLRRAFVWSCVPYLLLALFADVLHVHPLPSTDSAVVGGVHRIVNTSTERPYRIPDATCAICQWQRLGPRLQSATSVNSTMLSGPTLVDSLVAAFPKSPIPHPSAFRGPPPSFS